MPKITKGIFSFFLLCVLFSIGFIQVTIASPAAQVDPNVRVVTDAQTGLYNFVGIDSGRVGTALPGATALQNGTPTAATALADIGIYARQFGLSNPTQELQFLKASASQGGSRSFRYQQVYQGIPVIAGEMIANYDRRGRLSAIVGEVSGSLTVPTTPRLTADIATRTALGYVARAKGLQVSDLSATTPALWIYDPRLVTPDTFPATLAWRLEVRAATGLAPIWYVILVDALNGGVVLGFNQIDTAWHGAVAAKPAAVAAPHVALPIVAAPQSFPNFDDPPGATYDSHSSSDLGGVGNSTLACNTRPANPVGSGLCSGEAAAAHYFAYDTFDFYDFHFNRDSIDDNHMALISNVEYCEPNPVFGIFCPGGFFNAFWDGQQMVYGDGAFFAADDIVGHELTHGVTQYTSGLMYLFESGAINEAMSDIYGEFIDQENGVNSIGQGEGPANNWMIGEDLSFGAIRNMANPPAFGDPDRTQSALYQKDANFDDNGGVHFNSGVVNKAAYLMAAGGAFNGRTITALGNDKTGAIFYEVNNNLLPTGADFSILGAAMVQACNNLVGTLGIIAADCIEVEEATLATEMQLDPVAGVVFRPKADLCPAGNGLHQTLFTDDMESGTGNYTSTVHEDDILILNVAQSIAWQNSNNAPAGYGPYDDDGTNSLFGANYGDVYGFKEGGPTDVYRSSATMNSSIFLPAGSTYYLHFNHSFALEYFGSTNYDGGVLEYELDGSNNWIDTGSLYEAGQNYNGIIYTNPIPDERNPLAGRKGFVQTSHGFVSTRFNLKSLAGHSVRFRWVIGADYFSFYGWYVDDIQVYNCISNTAAPNRNYTTDTTPTLTWSAITWATKYQVEIATNSTFTAGLMTYSDIPASDLSFTIPIEDELALGTYYWRVRVYQGDTPKGYSPTEAITISPP